MTNTRMTINGYTSSASRAIDGSLLPDTVVMVSVIPAV